MTGLGAMRTINIGSVKALSDALRRDYDPEIEQKNIGRTVLLIGAGCSYSAGIPLARDIAQSLICQLALAYRVVTDLSISPAIALKNLIEKDYFRGDDVFTNDDLGVERANWSLVYDRLFTEHYNSPKEVRKIFSRIFENTGNAINWTHVCIGELVRAGYVSTVLSTNFDQLALEGIARTGRLPIVADGLEYLGRITGDSIQPQLIQIHGSRHTYHLRNSKEDTEELSRDHGARHAIDELFRTARVFVVVGYGGREKGIMELLIEAGKRYPDTRIFWCSHSESPEELSKFAKSFLCTSKYSSIIHGYDSDELFDTLLDQLGTKVPKLIEDPLYVLRQLTENIAFAENSSIAQKIRLLQSKTFDLRVAEAHMIALSPIDRPQYSEAAIQNQKMQAVGQLAAGIAHDFNNVLTAIIMASDLLLSNHRPSDASFPDIVNIKQNANRAASLVRQLLAFSRKQTLRPEVLSLTEVLTDLRMLLARLVGNAVKLKIDHGRDLWPVKVDLGQFEQVVVNLVVNARDAMPEGGDLTIRTRNVSTEESKSLPYRELVPSEYVLAEVEDTGTGIEPEIIEKIFDPFFTTKAVGKGSGLGLSMVYGIIKQTGGFIYCDSVVGRGTVFRIFLSRYVPDAKAALEDTTIRTEAANTAKALAGRSVVKRDLSGSATVLLVEDDDAVRMGGARALSSAGYTVHEASSGVEALAMFEELRGRVDIVVSNLAMPEMDGLTLLGELRKRQESIKFIFVSGYAEDAFALPEDGSFGFLPKPFSLKQLKQIVRDVLQE